MKFVFSNHVFFFALNPEKSISTPIYGTLEQINSRSQASLYLESRVKP